MCFDNALADGESQPGAADTLRALDTVELVEDAGKIIRGNPNPTVQNLEAGFLVIHRSSHFDQ